MKAWNSSKNDCGLFVKNQTQRQLYLKHFIIVEMIVKDEGS